jgi:hypothetical protein
MGMEQTHPQQRHLDVYLITLMARLTLYILQQNNCFLEPVDEILAKRARANVPTGW